jgi:hypothetical protein
VAVVRTDHPPSRLTRYTLLVGDFDADGKADIAFAWYDSALGLRIRTKFSNGDGTYPEREDILGDGGAIWNKGAPQIGDFDADGKHDIAFAWYDSKLGLRVRTKFSNGDGTFTATEHILGDGSAIWNRGAPLVADFDHDGDADIFCAWYESSKGLGMRTKLANFE